MKIKNVQATEILDSRGNPTVQTTIELDNGIKAFASVPSGASTGKFEALELRDGDEKRYGGKGVLKVCDNVNLNIAKILRGYDVLAQEEIDQKMIALDGTKNKENLGANAILSVSLAVARAAAKSQGKSLFEHIHTTFEFKEKYKIPAPMFNILNGGKHSDSGLDVQEFMIVPNKVKSFAEQLRAGSELYYILMKNLKNKGYNVSVGDEGGFAPRLESNKQALEIIQEVINNSGYKGKVQMALDVASSEFYDGNAEEYIFKQGKVKLNAEQMIAMYKEWIKTYNIFSIEDGLAEEAWDDWTKMAGNITSKNKNVLLVGDDFLVTNVLRLKRAIEMKSANAILIKPNQIGTLTETINCIKEAQKAGWKVIVSHRSGETCDDFIADLAVGAHADYIKSGAPCRGERLAKYNRLLAIEKGLLLKLK